MLHFWTEPNAYPLVIQGHGNPNIMDVKMTYEHLWKWMDENDIHRIDDIEN